MEEYDESIHSHIESVKLNLFTSRLLRVIKLTPSNMRPLTVLSSPANSHSRIVKASFVGSQNTHAR